MKIEFVQRPTHLIFSTRNDQNRVLWRGGRIIPGSKFQDVWSQNFGRLFQWFTGKALDVWCFFLGWGRFLRLCVFGLASSPPSRLLSVPHCSAHRSQTRSDCSRQYEGDSVFCASKYFPQYHSVHCGIIKLNCLISFPLQRNWQTQHFHSLFFNCNKKVHPRHLNTDYSK